MTLRASNQVLCNLWLYNFYIENLSLCLPLSLSLCALAETLLMSIHKRLFSLRNSIVVILSSPLVLDENVFVCVEVLRPSQPNGVMSSAVSLPSHTFTGQA